MAKWPRSNWVQASISVASASLCAAVAFVSENKNLFSRYAREAPRDGQDGLAAFMGAVEAAFVTFCLVWAVSFLLQRLLTQRRLSGH